LLPVLFAFCNVSSALEWLTLCCSDAELWCEQTKQNSTVYISALIARLPLWLWSTVVLLMMMMMMMMMMETCWILFELNVCDVTSDVWVKPKSPARQAAAGSSSSLWPSPRSSSSQWPTYKIPRSACHCQLMSVCFCCIKSRVSKLFCPSAPQNVLKVSIGPHLTKELTLRSRETGSGGSCGRN